MGGDKQLQSELFRYCPYLGFSISLNLLLMFLSIVTICTHHAPHTIIAGYQRQRKNLESREKKLIFKGIIIRVVTDFLVVTIDKSFLSVLGKNTFSMHFQVK